MHETAGVSDATVQRDVGFSLVEVIMAITIMGIVLLPVLDAVFANVRASSQLRESAHVETVLQNAADRINRAPKVCDYRIYASAAAQTEGWPASTATVQASRYQPGATPAVAGTWLTGACGGNTPADLLVQRVLITVSNPNNTLQRSMYVVKSDV